MRRAGAAKWFAVAIVLTVAGLSGCARTPHEKAARFMERGKALRAQKDYARAILQFRNAIQSDPSDADPYYELALTDLMAGDIRSGVVNLRKATELNPRHAAAQLKLAELMTNTRSKDILEEAQKRLQSVLKLPDGGSAEALNTLAFAELRLGKPGVAEQHLKEALAKFPENLKSSASLAGMKLAKGDLKGSEAILKEAVDRAPKSAEAKIALAQLYLYLNRLSDAEAQLRASLELDPKNGIALLGLAGLQERAGHPEETEETLRRVSALPEPRYKLVHALYLYQHEKRPAAIEEFERLVRQDPKDRAARTHLITAYVDNGRTGEAEKALAAALQANPKDTDALLQRSEIYIRGEKYADAQRDLTQILKFRPDSAEVHYLLGRLDSFRGAGLQARQEFGEALRLNSRLLPARIELARQFLSDRSAKAALDTLNAASPAQRKSLPVIIQRNWAFEAMSDRAALRKGIDEGLKIEPAPDLLLQDGLLKIAEGNYSGAQASLREGSRKAPDDPRFIDALARAYSAQKDPGKAVETVRQFASAHTRSAAAQHLLGDWLLKSGHRTEARSAFTAAKAADPAYAAADLVLAQFDIEDGKFDSARQRLAPLLTWQPDNFRAQSSGLSAHVLLGNLEVMAGQHSKAVEHYRRVVGLNQTNVMALNNLAYLLVEYEKQPEEALKFAQRAKEIDPRNPSVADTIGWIYYRKGIYRTAVQHLELAASANSPQMKYHLAMAYMKSGDSKRGQQVLQEALRLNPKLVEAEMAKDIRDDNRPQRNAASAGSLDTRSAADPAEA